jgi:hypothetical protein
MHAGESDLSPFLVPTLYSYGECSAVPQPQTLTIYLNTHKHDGQSRATLTGMGKSTVRALWHLSRDNEINNVFEFPLIELNHEALYPFFCLNYYCYGEPTEEVLTESNGTCNRRRAASGVYGIIDEDPTVSFIVANKGPNFIHVYPALPINYLSSNATYYILNPTRYQDGYIQGIALRALENGTEVTLVPTVDVSIFRPATLDMEVETVGAYEEFVLYFDPLETVWIEVEVQSCDGTVSLTGTQIISSDELAVFSTQALCNSTSSPNNRVLPFSSIISPLRQLPPVSKWGTQYITDLKKLSSFPEAGGEFYFVSFSIQTDVKSTVNITCFHGDEMMPACSAHQVLGPGEVWHYKLQLKTMLDAEVIYIEGTTPIIVLHEVYSQRREDVYHSEMLQPTEWFSTKQMLPVLQPFDSQPEVFVVNLIVPDAHLKTRQIRVWDNAENEEPSELDDFSLIFNYSLSVIQGDTLVRIFLVPTAYNRSRDYVLHFNITDEESGKQIKYGASIFSFGAYAYSSGYVLGK